MAAQMVDQLRAVQGEGDRQEAASEEDPDDPLPFLEASSAAAAPPQAVPVPPQEPRWYAAAAAGPTTSEPPAKRAKLRDIPTEFNAKALGLDPAFRLTRYTNVKARACKVSTVVIDNMLKAFQDENTDPAKGSLGLGMDASISPSRHGGLALIQASDLFYPCVEDPYSQGRIACSSLLSEMYAVGVTDIDNMLMKLAVSSSMTDKERDTVIPIMLKGFQECAKAAGTRVTGGQTVVNPWCMVGGVASAVCDHNEYIIPDQACVGDVLVLTKPLGTQVAVNCHDWMQNPATRQKLKLVITEQEAEKAYNRALDSMQRLNLDAARLLHKHKAHGATTIAGFGLLGHAMALARCQRNEVTFVIHNLPVIAKMAAVARSKGNMFQLNQGLACEMGGGLLVCLPREQAAAFCKDIEASKNCQAWIIGIVEKGDRSARIIDKPRIIEVPARDRDGELW